MNFLEIYDTLGNLLEAEDVQQSLSKSAKIKYYYNIDYKVPFYWSESGYGHPWFEFANAASKDYRTNPYSGIPGVYLIVNKITCQAYVGKAVDIANRMYTHSLYAGPKPPVKKDSIFLHIAMQHHKLAAFKWTVLETIPETILALGEESKVAAWFIEKEQYYIKKFKTYEQVEHYNLTAGGENPPIYFKYSNDLIKQVQQYIDEHPLESSAIVANKFPELSSPRIVADINNGLGRFGRVKYRSDLTFPIRDAKLPNSEHEPKVTKARGYKLNTVASAFSQKLSRYPWYFIKTTEVESGNYTFERLDKSPDKNFVQGLESLELDFTNNNDLSKVVPYLTDSRYSHYYPKQGFYLTKIKLTDKDFDWWADQYSARNIK
jgi:hypothetical protein